jgi:hypothetical protein
MLKRLDYQIIKNGFTLHNYILLSEKYINNHTKLEYECPNKHIHYVRWSDWEKGIRCPYCSGNIKKDLNFIESKFREDGYILTSFFYKNCYTKLEYLCPEGHIGSVSWNDWRQGCRCATCADIKNSIRISGSGHPNWQGGISYEPYCPIWSDKEYKQDIKLRDNNKCLNPYCSFKNPNDLVIHHIDYNKKHCHPNNLITICRICNNAANKDREWHTAWYRALMYRRYNYEYY